MAETWALILAAGKSERMGSNKLLLPFGDKTMIGKVIGNVMDSGINNILVVLGPFRDELLPMIKTLRVRHCYNKDYSQGMLSSVQCGLLNIPVNMDRLLIFLGDQPMIPGKVAHRLIKAGEESGKGIVIPVYKGKRGHPVLIDKKYREAIGNLNREEGLRALMHQFPADVQEVAVEVPAILRDIDNKPDYLNETKLK